MSKALLFAAGLAITGIALAAQEPPSLTEAQEDQKAAEEALAKLDAQLHLSPAQKAKVLPILAERKQRMKALASETGGRKLAKLRKAKAIVDESDQKLLPLLTEDQREAYRRLQAERKEKAKERLQEHRGAGTS